MSAEEPTRIEPDQHKVHDLVQVVHEKDTCVQQQQQQQETTATTTNSIPVTDQKTTEQHSKVQKQWFQRRFNGTKPNVHWRSYDKEDLVLESDGRFVPLEAGSGEEECTFAVQGSEAWFRQREGRVTGSMFATVLGFFERKAGKILGTKAFASHEKALLARERLCCGRQGAEADRQIQFDEATIVRMDWGSHHELNAVLTLLQDKPSFKIHETGFWIFESENMPQEVTLHFDDLPSMGASPDGIIYDSSVSLTEPQYLLEVKCPAPFVPVYERKKKKKEEENKEVDKVAGDKEAELSEKKGDDNGTINELKTDDVSSWNGKKSEADSSKVNNNDNKNKRRYQYIKRKPFEKIPVYYIPQIQAQMLCTGIHKSVFVSYTPTGGMTVFEMDFDPEYTSIMLKVLHDFHHLYVLPAQTRQEEEEDVPLPELEEDYFFEEEHYQDLLLRTKQLQENCQVLRTVDRVAKSQRHLDLFLESDDE